MEKFEKNNVTIALNVLYAKNEKIYPAYVSNNNPNLEKKVILLMIPNREKSYYLSALLRGIMSNHYELKIINSRKKKMKLLTKEQQ